MKKKLEKISIILFIAFTGVAFTAFSTTEAQGRSRLKMVIHSMNITPVMSQKEFDKIQEDSSRAKETEVFLAETYQEDLFKSRVINALIAPYDEEGLAKSGKSGLPFLEMPAKELEELNLSPSIISTINATIQNDDEIDKAPPVSLSKKSSVVTEIAPGIFDVDEDFEKITDDVILMNQLAYAIGKRGTINGSYDKLIKKLKGQFAENGWGIWEFEGMTGKGNTVHDTPGFVAYNKQTNNMTVILRGSQTREDDIGSPDWAVNYDAGHIPSPFGGTVHRGYYNRMLTIMPNIKIIMKALIEHMEADEKSNLKITVSGHSQGGGLASIALPMITEMLEKTKILGKEFNNSEDNVVRGYLLSSPRVFAGEEARERIHRTIGKDNIIRQQVIGNILADPVPLATPGKTLTALISLIPFKGEKWAEKYGSRTGNVSLGYLAGDLSKDAIKRSLARTAGDFILERAQRNLRFSLDYIEMSIKYPIYSPSLKNAKDFFKNMLLDVKRTAFLFLAPLHYGNPEQKIEPGKSFFNPEIVGGYGENSLTIADLLHQGYVFRNNERKGLDGVVRTAIETLADINKTIPSLSGAVAGIKKAPRKIAKTLKGAFKKFKNQFA